MGPGCHFVTDRGIWGRREVDRERAELSNIRIKEVPYIFLAVVLVHLHCYKGISEAG